MAKKHNRKPVHSPRPATPAPATPKPDQIVPASPVPAVLLTVNQVCELLGGISRSTLVRMEKTGKIPGRVQLGCSVRYHRETVETWVKSLLSNSCSKPSTP